MSMCLVLLPGLVSGLLIGASLGGVGSGDNGAGDIFIGETGPDCKLKGLLRFPLCFD